MKALGAVLGVLGVIALVVGAFAVETWLAMLLIGAVHGSVYAGVPALGYGASAVVVLALTFLAALFKSSRS